MSRSRSLRPARPPAEPADRPGRHLPGRPGHAGAAAEHWLSFGLLLLASGCLYSAGMVWNDYFDRRTRSPGTSVPSISVLT